MGSWKALKTSAGSGWKEIDRAAGTGWKELSWDDAGIDVGAACSDRTSGQNSGNTMLGKANPANNTGTLTSLCVWVLTNMGGIKIGSFYLVSGTTYKCRDAESIGSLNAGKNDNIVISLSIQTNDYLGIYWSSGQIEADTAGGGAYYVAGDKCIINNETAYSLSGTWEGSFYAEG